MMETGPLCACPPEDRCRQAGKRAMACRDVRAASWVVPSAQFMAARFVPGSGGAHVAGGGVRGTSIGRKGIALQREEGLGAPWLSRSPLSSAALIAGELSRRALIPSRPAPDPHTFRADGL